MQIDAKMRSCWPGEMPAIAQAAEAFGFDGLRVSETVHDPYLLLGMAAEHTRRLSLGPSIAIAFPRSPMITAIMAWDVQHLSGGRLTLGLGSQVQAHIVGRFSTPWEAPAARMRDYIESLRAIWRSFQEGCPLRHEGRFYRFTLITPQWNPGPIERPHVPVFMAAVGPLMLRACGAVADGIYLHPLSTRKYIRDVAQPTIAAAARENKRSPEQVALSASAFVITGRNAQEIQEEAQQVKTTIAFYAATPTYRNTILKLHGWEEVGHRLSQLAREGKWRDMASLLPEDMVKEIAVTGAWDEIGPQLVEKYGRATQRVMVYRDFRPGEIDGFWKTLIPAVRAG